MRRRLNTILFALLAVGLLPAPTIAQSEQYVSAGNASFEWTGKQDRSALFSWSATVENPSKRRNVEVRVSLVLVDAAGETVATDSVTVTLQNESSADVGQGGSLPYDDAARVAQYRVAVEPLD